jgi:L-arabinose isomerase
MKKNNIRVGLFGIGLDTYWPQFDGLLDSLMGYQGEIKEKIASFGVEVADAGMVDNPVKEREAADFLKSQDIEIVFLYVSTYALSSTVFTRGSKTKSTLSDTQFAADCTIRL